MAKERAEVGDETSCQCFVRDFQILRANFSFFFLSLAGIPKALGDFASRETRNCVSANAKDNIWFSMCPESISWLDKDGRVRRDQ